ncbi:MAG TPA: TetR/AcrR family transcriptional regulator [Kofleriaceae bacterium]
MTKRKPGRPPAGPERRDAILDAALECFVDRGFHGTAMPDIAKKTGIAAGTIYHYFASKEELVNALFRKWKAEIARRVFTAFPQGAPTRQQFQVMWREMIAFALAHPAAFAFLELHNHSSYLDAESVAADRGLKIFAGAIVQQAQKDGVIKPLDAALLMELVFGAFIGIMRAHWEGRASLTPEQIDEAEQACWDAVATHA